MSAIVGQETTVSDQFRQDARLDRNWGELLQELRVAQTGVQILTAFLLTVPFSARFTELTDPQRGLYLTVLVSAMASVVLLLTPVALHRGLFHRGERPWLVDTADQLARAGLLLLAVANLGATYLVVNVVVGHLAAVLVTIPLAALVIVLWWWLPLRVRRRHHSAG